MSLVKKIKRVEGKSRVNSKSSIKETSSDDIKYLKMNRMSYDINVTSIQTTNLFHKLLNKSKESNDCLMFSSKNGMLISPINNTEESKLTSIKKIGMDRFRKLIKNYTESIRRFSSKSLPNTPGNRFSALQKIELEEVHKRPSDQVTLKKK